MACKCIVVDYGVGNIFSIMKSIAAVGHEPELSRDPATIKNATHVILPGVGAFKHASDKLKNLGLNECLKQFSTDGGNLLGICVGMQLLFTKSFEGGTHTGLNLIEGEVREIKQRVKNIRTPIIGWQEITSKQTSFPLDSEHGKLFYHVHSFECFPKDESVITSTYKIQKQEVCSSVRKQNTIGVQFHPEKSGKNGLRFIKNFLEQRS